MLATDQRELSTELVREFPRIVTLDEPVPLTGMQKLKALLNTPYHRTLLVDPGMVFCHEVSGVFQFVDNFDLAAPLVRDDLLFQTMRPDQAQSLFVVLREQHASALSSAFLVAKRSLRTERFVQQWLLSMTRTTARSDDFWMSRLLPKSDVRFVPLPTEYALVAYATSRLPVPLLGTVVSFHTPNRPLPPDGGAADAPAPPTPSILSCAALNQAYEPRVYRPDRQEVVTITALSMSYVAPEQTNAGAGGDARIGGLVRVGGSGNEGRAEGAGELARAEEALAAEAQTGEDKALQVPVDERVRATVSSQSATLPPMSGQTETLVREAPPDAVLVSDRD
jgi:hypothetical protein